MRKVFFVAFAAVFLSHAASAWDHHCRFESASERTLPAGGAGLMDIDARAGTLRVEGVSGATEIAVEATACATRKELLEQVTWRLDRDGETVRLAVQLPGGSDDGEYATLDLVVKVPAGLDMTIRDTSGSMTLRDVGALRVRDTSGSIDIRGAAGSVSIRDRSGSLSVSEVKGDLDIEDGSGSIDIAGVGGSVLINDGSGSIEVDEVAGSVEIEDDGSGSIDVADIGGEFIVREDGSGGIRHRRVAGRVSLPDRD